MDSSTSPVVSNIVISYTLNFSIVLEFLEFVLDNVKYNKNKFNGAICKDFGCCLLIFRNGKINVVGAKTEKIADDAIKLFCEKTYNPLEIKEKRIVNMVASSFIGTGINLLKLMERSSGEFDYHPELFPSAYYSVSGTREKVAIHHTGKLVFTGFKTAQNIQNVHHSLLNILKKYDLLKKD